jgi:capsular polysaccharide biosynthesis protein
LPESSAPDDAVTVGEALRTLRERWWILLAAAVLAAVAAFVYTRLPWVEQRWRSSVLIQATGRLDYGNFLALEKELRPLAEQVRQLGVMREVNTNLHTDVPPEVMLDHTRAEPVQDSGQIRLDIEDSDPRRAEQISLEIANVYTRQHNAAEQGKLREERVILSTLDRQNEATLIWPQTRILVAAAAVLGVVVAGLVVLGLVYVDDSIRSAADVQEYLALPVLGSIPRHRASSVSRLARRSESTPAQADAPTAAAQL